MKKIILKSTMAVCFLFALTTHAQTEPKKMKAAACGEKGHTCTDACHKSETKKAKMKNMEMKDHVCTSKCSSEKHAIVCGEKGHTCTAACKKM